MDNAESRLDYELLIYRRVAQEKDINLKESFEDIERLLGSWGFPKEPLPEFFDSKLQAWAFRHSNSYAVDGTLLTHVIFYERPNGRLLQGNYFYLSEVTSPVSVITAGHRHPGVELVLHFCPEIPREVADTKAAADIVGIACGAGVVLAEVQIGERSALAVRGRVEQVTVRNVISVGVVPRAGDAGHRGRDRVAEAVPR